MTTTRMMFEVAHTAIEAGRMPKEDLAAAIIDILRQVHVERQTGVLTASWPELSLSMEGLRRHWKEKCDHNFVRTDRQPAAEPASRDVSARSLDAVCELSPDDAEKVFDVARTFLILAEHAESSERQRE